MKQKYLALYSFSALVEGEDEADAAVNAGFGLKHPYSLDRKSIRNVNIKIVRAEKPSAVPAAIAEAPFADELRPVNEETAQAIQPVPGLAPEENQTHMPVAVTADDMPF